MLILKLTGKLDLRRGKKSVASSNLSIYYSWKKMKKPSNNNKFKISAPTLNDKFELPDGSYSTSDVQDYFEFILKKHNKSFDNPSIRIYVNKIENRVTSEIKRGCYLEILTHETMILLGGAESKITNNKNGENELHLEITEVVLYYSSL